ncbi:hypothetical protein vseg_005356 [Gypsophila vaccaria]
MGKSSKKSATKVEVAPVAVPVSAKKGKRSAENEIEKAASAKKQKVERDETVTAKQKIEKKLPKKVASSSSDESSDDSDSDSDSEAKVVAKKTPVAAAKNGSVLAKKSKDETSSESSESSDSDSDDSDEKPAAKKQPAAVKNGSAAVKKAAASDSSSSESDSEDEKPAAKKQPAAVKNGTPTVKKPAASDSSSSESDDDSSSEDEKPAAALKNSTKDSSSSDSDSDSSDEEEVKKAAAPAPAKAKVESSDSDSDEDSDDSDDEEPKANNAKVTPVVNAGKPVAKKSEADSSSSEEESSDDDSSDDEPAKAQPAKKVQATSKSESSSSDESSDEDESDEDETKKESLKTPKKKDTDVEMVDAEKSAGSTFQNTPKTPATPAATGSKTLFVGNLSFKVEEADVRDFFKDAGEIVDVRFASNSEGLFRGFGHVEFATAEAAQKAMELHDQPLLDRPVRLDVARERDSNFTPQNRENSFQKGGKPQGQTVFVRGFDTSVEADEIESALRTHFGSCGEITRVSIPRDYESGTVKGICYMDFANSDGFNAALGLDGSDIGGGYFLNVQEAKPREPRGDSAGGSGGRFDRGGSGGRRGGGRFSSRGGRDGGGRFSGRGGRDGGRGRGRGTPYNKPSITGIASGKKTTFGDD